MQITLDRLPKSITRLLESHEVWWVLAFAHGAEQGPRQIAYIPSTITVEVQIAGEAQIVILEREDAPLSEAIGRSNFVEVCRTDTIICELLGC